MPFRIRRSVLPEFMRRDCSEIMSPRKRVTRRKSRRGLVYSGRGTWLVPLFAGSRLGCDRLADGCFSLEAVIPLFLAGRITLVIGLQQELWLRR